MKLFLLIESALISGRGAKTFAKSPSRQSCFIGPGMNPVFFKIPTHSTGVVMAGNASSERLALTVHTQQSLHQLLDFRLQRGAFALRLAITRLQLLFQRLARLPFLLQQRPPILCSLIPRAGCQF